MNSLEGQVANYVAELSNTNLTATTRRQYKSSVKAFLDWTSASQTIFRGDCTIEDLKNSVTAYTTYLAEEHELKQASINCILTALTHYFAFLGFRDVELSRLPREIRLPRTLRDFEQKDMLAAIAKANERDQAIVLLFYMGGLRIGECASLNRDDLHFYDPVPQLIVHHPVKRMVPLNSILKDGLSAWMSCPERKRSFERALFINRDSQRLSVASIDQVVRKVGRIARLNVSAQLLRNTCISNLMAHGFDTLAISQITGAHTDLLRVYRRLSQREALNIMETIVVSR